MIVLKHKHAAVLKVRNPGSVQKVIPHCKTFDFRGRELVAVPHKEEEVKVLRNLGINVPAPILYYYGWPRDEVIIPEPFKAQYATAAFLTLNDRAYCLNGLGSGKTLAALWAYDNLRQRCNLGKLLIVAPLSTLELTWSAAIEEHFPHLTFMVLHASRAKRLKMLEEDVDVYIINHHGAKIIEEAMQKRPDIELVIVDELSQCARNARTDIWKSLDSIVNGAKKVKNKIKRWCWGMTATPTPTEPSNAWAQAKLVTPWQVPPYFKRYKEKVMKQVGPYLWINREEATDIVYDTLQPAIRFSREECVDLPPTTYTELHVPLTKEQEKSYKEMSRDLKAQVESGDITAANEAIKASKLVQIACGILYGGEDNRTSLIPSKPRLEETIDLLRSADSCAIVFCPFRAVVEFVAEKLAEIGYRVGIVHGGINKTARTDVFNSFQHRGELDVIVAQPGAMSHGLTLTAASTIVWYAPITSADIFEQANGRITRPGQTHNTLIAMISGTPIERLMYARLKAKQKMQNLLLDRVVEDRAA